MNIMDRITRIARANINGLLDDAENPEVMLDQILRDMEEGISEARQQIASMIAQEKMLSGDAAENHALGDSFAEHAGRAVAAGQDDLAREALRRQRDYTANADVYDQQVQSQQALIGRMKEELATLEAKFRTTLAQRDTLIARHRAAKSELKVVDSINATSPYDPMSELRRIERKIRSTEANVAASNEVSGDQFMQRIVELEVDDEIEAALLQLKAQAASSTDTPALKP